MKWISIDKHLPKKNKQIIICFKMHEYYVGIATYDGEKLYELITKKGRKKYINNTQVKYWMKLPSLPLDCVQHNKERRAKFHDILRKNINEMD